MADRHIGGVERSISRRLAVAVLVPSALLVVPGATAAPTVELIDRPADATQTADRLTPPGPSIAGCQVFPSDNAWNADVSGYPLHPRSEQIVARIQSVGGDHLHPDFGENPDYGIPYVVVPADQPLVPVEFTEWPEESDPGPYPVPLDAPV